jgi:hypothetical protein
VAVNKAIVPNYSGGPVPDFNRCSLLSFFKHLNNIAIFKKLPKVNPKKRKVSFKIVAAK